MITGDFVRTGGMDKANFHLADYWARQGAELHLVAHRVDEVLLKYPRVTFHPAGKPLGSYFLGEFFLRRKGRQLAKKLGAGATVIVNGGNCPLPGINWVHYVHAVAGEPRAGTFLRRLKGRLSHRLSVRAEKKALALARMIVANSERTKRDLVTKLGISAGRIQVIYYGADGPAAESLSARERDELRDRLGFPREKALFVFVGALGDRRKGFDILFEAWLALPKPIQDGSELLVVGTGGEIPAWKERAKNAGVEEQIRFLGFRRDVPAILQAVDALVSPTRYDSFGLAVLEALCAGVPAIVSGEAGVAERYPESVQELLLSEVEDPAGVAKKISFVFENRESLRKKMTAVAAQTADYSWDKMGRIFSDSIQAR